MDYERLDWDDVWAAMLAPLLDAWERQDQKESDRLDNRYDRFYVESAACRLYAERVLENPTSPA